MTAPDLTRAAWRKSTRSGPNDSNCVEVADLAGTGATAVRDSKDPGGPALLFGQVTWAAFVTGLRAGAFHRS